VWIEGLFTVRDEQGRERLLATYTRQPGLDPPSERGVAVFDDVTKQFRVLAQMPLIGGHIPSHPFRVTAQGKDYWYLIPHERVPNEWKAITNPMSYESYTCLESGARFDKAKPRLERRGTGELVYGWKPNTDWIGADEERELIARGLMKKRKLSFPFSMRIPALRPARRRAPLLGTLTGRNGSCWGRRRVRFTTQRRTIQLGRGGLPRRLSVTRFVQHPFFDQEGGRVIYLEGTYTSSFSDAKQDTPRYNYNQIMYRVRLDDPRLEALKARP
jgi:hypothetical protein